MTRCALDAFAVTLENEILKPFLLDEARVLKKDVTEIMEEMVAETKRDAPKDKGKYARSITHETQVRSLGIKETWGAKAPHYRLTHLLVNGHEVRGGGRYGGSPFLHNAVARAEARLEAKLRRDL